MTPFERGGGPSQHAGTAYETHVDTASSRCTIVPWSALVETAIAAGQMLLWAGAIRLAAELLGGMLR